MGKRSTNVKFVTLDVNRENLSALLKLLESGEVRVVIDKTYPLRETPAAIGYVEEGHARGKVVITLEA